MRFKKTGILFLTLIMFVCTFTACNGSEYKKAFELMEKGSYEEAETIFTQLGDYKDSAEMILECQYQTAQQFFYYEKYDNAVEIFQGLGNYKDSADVAIECRYLIAQEYFNSKKFLEALEIFQNLGDYKDSLYKTSDCKKGLAEYYFDNGEYKSAISIFEELGDYESVRKCNWEIVMDHFSQNSVKFEDGIDEYKFTVTIDVDSERDKLILTDVMAGEDTTSKLSFKIEKNNPNLTYVTYKYKLLADNYTMSAEVDLKRYSFFNDLEWNWGSEPIGFGASLLKSSIETNGNMSFASTYTKLENTITSGIGISFEDLGIG